MSMLPALFRVTDATGREFDSFHETTFEDAARAAAEHWGLPRPVFTVCDLATGQTRAVDASAPAPIEEIPEDRVRAYLDAERSDYIAYDGMGDGYRVLSVSDLRDVLRELDAARARIAVLEGARQWKVGDPDPTPTSPNGVYCDHLSPGGLACTWAPGHTEAHHVAGDGERIVAVWDVDDPIDPAPQGDPITSTTD